MLTSKVWCGNVPGVSLSGSREMSLQPALVGGDSNRALRVHHSKIVWHLRLPGDIRGTTEPFPSRPNGNAFHTSLTVVEGKTVFWIPDGKHFLIGKVMGDKWFE